MPKSACLEIHQIDVGAGDSVLVINRDLAAVEDEILQSGKLDQSDLDALDQIHYVPFAYKNKIRLKGTVRKALLVDGGDDEFGGNVYKYLVDHGAIDPKVKNQPDLTVLVSHYHEDHVAGLRYLVRKGAVGKREPRIHPARVYQAKTADWVGKICAEWRKYVNEDVAAGNTELVEVFPGGLDSKKKPITFDLGDGYKGMKITVTLVASGEQVRMEDKKNPKLNPVLKKIKSKDKFTGKPKFDPNDRSIVAVLQYGSFRVFLGGDIAGSGGVDGGNTGSLVMGKKSNSASATHGDAESPIGQALENIFEKTPAAANAPKFPNDGYCTVMKSDHHGSDSSNDVFLFGTIQPLLFLNSSGLRPKPHGHPTQQVISRATPTGEGKKWPLRPKGNTAKIDNTIKGLYITEVAKRWVTNTSKKKPSFKSRSVDFGSARIVGDIVVRPIDETVKKVQAASAFGQKLTVQVHGTGDQFDLDTYTKGLKQSIKNGFELFPVTSDDPSPHVTSEEEDCYVKGPWEHSDKH